MKRLTKSDTVLAEVVLIQFAMRFPTHTQKKRVQTEGVQLL